MRGEPKYVRAMIAELRRKHAIAKAEDQWSVRTRDLADAVSYLEGKGGQADHKIEARREDRRGVWIYTLLQGAMGYSAGTPIIRVDSSGGLREIPR